MLVKYCIIFIIFYVAFVSGNTASVNALKPIAVTSSDEPIIVETSYLEVKQEDNQSDSNDDDSRNGISNNASASTGNAADKGRSSRSTFINFNSGSQGTGLKSTGTYTREKNDRESNGALIMMIIIILILLCRKKREDDAKNEENAEQEPPQADADGILPPPSPTDLPPYSSVIIIPPEYSSYSNRVIGNSLSTPLPLNRDVPPPPYSSCKQQAIQNPLYDKLKIEIFGGYAKE